MCCIFCDEPVRSITVGLAAVGVVCLINGARKLIRPQSPDASMLARGAEADAGASLETESAS